MSALADSWLKLVIILVGLDKLKLRNYATANRKHKIVMRVCTRMMTNDRTRIKGQVKTERIGEYLNEPYFSRVTIVLHTVQTSY